MSSSGLHDIVNRKFWLSFLSIFILFVNIFPKLNGQLSEEVQVQKVSSSNRWIRVQSNFPSREMISISKTQLERKLLFENDSLLVSMGPVLSPSHGPERHKLLARRLSPNISPASPLVATTSSDASPPASNSSSNSNSTLAPSGFVQPPVSPHTSCCGPNMVLRRTSIKDCIPSNCVYPIKVEFYLRNVSLTSNWSSRFLEELSSQLNLRVSQFEIDNFYVVGATGLNISMDIAPEKEISFSQMEMYKLSDALASHKVKISPELVGDYLLLNLTWMRPPAPSPAPVVAISPKAAPPTKVPHLPVPSRSSEENSNSHSNLLTIIGICVGILIVIFVAVIIICVCSHCKSNKPQAEEAETYKPALTREAISACGSLPRPTSTRFISFEELKEATDNFNPSCMLGEGGFGRVFKGVLTDGTAVAIKKLTSGGHQGDKEFLVEVEMLSRLHHRNLVKLIGYYSSRDSTQNLLCYELIPNGSLEAWLHGPLGANSPLDWDTRMKIALDAARGLAYLHEDSQPCVIHRDFKSSNILLENDFHAKVSDFGLAKQAPEGQANHLSTRVMGTFGYVAPEYAMTGHLLVKSDVYSYGVVLLELLTGKRPVDHMQPVGQENLVTWARPILRDKDRLDELADPGLRGNYPKEDFLRVCTIAAACVALEANQRPTMGEVVQSLKMVQRTSAEYQDSVATPSSVRPTNNNNNTNINSNNRTINYESDCTSSMFSSGPFSGLSFCDNENVNRTAVFSEDLHEGR
ncbi:Protein kinase superfamily protein [Rhynchospora pubera]|uniref:Protein kinase superfamily protein n=1 Tax=Rhynchospora pubera TaxID=906938 RepID=A0AAV8F882_9POAL|nr:Protein kinase superfamily protein [Rhynchospora pubera]